MKETITLPVTTLTLSAEEVSIALTEYVRKRGKAVPEKFFWKTWERNSGSSTFGTAAAEITY